MSDVQSQNDATNMMILNIDSDQEVSYIESVLERQSVGNVCVTPRGSRYWTPVVPENEKPVKKMLFVSLDKAIEFYNNYAKKLDLNLVEQKGKRVTTSKRTGCEAHIILKYLHKRNLYEVVEFNEEHNHSMVHKDDFHFLNSQRQLNFCQKQTLMDVENLNMGPCKGFKVLKQARGSYDKVGATETDSKNYKRDIDLFIGEGDAHMAIEKLEKKKELLPDFSYEFMQDEDKKLSGLFWAEETAKQKFGDKLGSTLCQSGFLERINDIVWSKTLTPEQFKLKWASLMNEYDQQEHKWLSDMYDIRDSWIPSYFRDLPLAGLMQTTSRCEGENYFFGLLTNTDLFLVEFINHFETAMDAQRNIQRNNDHDSRNPNISSNKGGIGGKKRLISLKDKAIAKAQKTNLRRCNYCEQLANHDIHNCPIKKKDEEDQQKKLEAQKKSEANQKHGANHQAFTSGSEV
nr:protein FAR1-related sequence 5-like [Tanacetum cinerariifolium]